MSLIFSGKMQTADAYQKSSNNSGSSSLIDLTENFDELRSKVDTKPSSFGNHFTGIFLLLIYLIKRPRGSLRKRI